MNRVVVLSAAVLFAVTSTLHAAETARVRMFCLSLQFQKATAVDFVGFQWTVDLTTISVGNNGELASYFLTTNYSHSAYIDVYSELYDSTDSGAIAMDVPGGGDYNGNGFPDFWEVTQPVNGLTSSGVFQSTGFGYNNNITITWNRAAGSAIGYCSYSIPDPSYPSANMAVGHMFTLHEYDGTLTYTPGSSVVSGSVFLTETNSGNTLGGTFQFVKSPTNRFDMLTLQTVNWTNAAGQPFSLYDPNGPYAFLRDTRWPTNYYGVFQFVDGDPNTPEDDYYSWEMSIDDTNDANHDGVPDFSDDPAVVPPPSQPVLSLLRTPTNLLLTIEGDINHVHLVQTNDSLSSANWQTEETLTLTNQSQTVSLPLPSAERQFWRVLAQ